MPHVDQQGLLGRQIASIHRHHAEMKTHHKLIGSLVREVRALRDQVRQLSTERDEWQEAFEGADTRASREKEDKRKAERNLQQLEDEFRSRDYERACAVEKLERAKRYNDEWAKFAQCFAAFEMKEQLTTPARSAGEPGK